MGAEPGSAGEALAAGGLPDAMDEDVELAQRQDTDAGEEAGADEVDVVGKGVVSGDTLVATMGKLSLLGDFNFCCVS